MLGYEERVSILQGAEAVIFDMVCERSTPEQWAEWLRVPLEHAAGKGDIDLVGKLMKAGVDGSAGWKGCEGKSLLHAAAEGGNEQVMSALITVGAKSDINTTAPANGRTPLHVAARGGKVAAAKMLMMAGADVNIVDANNEGPLHLAVMAGHTGVAENLLLCGADPEKKLSSFFPIHLAAGLGQDGVVRNLLYRGAHVNRKCAHGWTALGHAVRHDHLSTVKVLLDGGADVAIMSGGQPPLHIAVGRDNTDILAALVEAGAAVEARNGNGQAPLHWAAYRGRNAAMRALLQLGANVHATARTGSTPLHTACHKGLLDGADLLLRWGADETTLDTKGRTPSARIPKIAKAAEEDRPRLERLSKLLASAPQDRAWRRRGMLVMCRAHPDRLRLGAKLPDTAEAIEQPQGRPSQRPRRSEVKVDVTRGDARGGSAGGAGGNSAGGGGGGFDGVVAWLMALEEDVFRTIVGFL